MPGGSTEPYGGTRHLLYYDEEVRCVVRRIMNRGILMLEQILATLEDLRDRVEVAQERL